jgi:hypothetical protein
LSPTPDSCPCLWPLTLAVDLASHCAAAGTRGAALCARECGGRCPGWVYKRHEPGVKVSPYRCGGPARAVRSCRSIKVSALHGTIPLTHISAWYMPSSRGSSPRHASITLYMSSRVRAARGACAGPAVEISSLSSSSSTEACSAPAIAVRVLIFADFLLPRSRPFMTLALSPARSARSTRVSPCLWRSSCIALPFTETPAGLLPGLFRLLLMQDWHMLLWL